MVTSATTRPASADVAPERLANNPMLSEQEKIGEASRQFEAILLRQILSATQKTVIQSKYADNSTASEIYRDLVTNQLAETMSKSGAFGLAKTFEHQLTKPGAQSTPRPATPDSPTAPGQQVVSNHSGYALCRPTAETVRTHPHE
jgi:peptidoglycan hydrolase FlgJ